MFMYLKEMKYKIETKCSVVSCLLLFIYLIYEKKRDSADENCK